MLVDHRQIVIDGPAASGKSTVARLVAERLKAVYINTGDMYRAVTWVARERGVDIEKHPEEVVALLSGIDLRYRIEVGGRPILTLDGGPVPQEAVRDPQVTAQVSLVAKIPEVRSWLVARQRESANLGLVVMEGRDIGTVVFPQAAHKFFLTASTEERARRRLAQGGETAAGATIESVAREIARRDRIDSTREVAPLRAAADAVRIDSTALTAEQVVAAIVARVAAAEGGRHG